MKRLLILAGVVVAGCATPLTPEQINARVKVASDYQLCQVAVLGHSDPRVVTIVGWEIRVRSLNCATYAQAIVQQDAANKQAAAAYLANMPRPQPIQMPMPAPPVHCSSYRYGNQVQTTCQ